MNVNDQWQELTFHNEEKEGNDSSTFADNKVLRMMKMMGYQSGSGLGKNEQGVTHPVMVEPHLERRGFGLTIEHLQYSNEEWDFSLEDTSTVEKVEWLQNTADFKFNVDAMIEWLKEDKPNIDIEKEDYFCDKETLHDVIAAKNIFDELDVRELSQARGRANPFETIRSVFFMNRASLKMANIDAATGFVFTKINEDPFHQDSEGPYYFADVCAGPGGFTEYILWRKKWLFKGFGLTLRCENDFKLTDSVCTSSVTFLPLYGIHEDGNVCCPENINDFKEKVLFETEGKGVHFMMSDGGFSVEGNENLQEILSKNIYICQCLVALEILKEHGHFVTKVFDLFTCFSVGLMYLMYNSFEKLCIFKPNSSRPANSERYLICYNYKGSKHTQSIKLYMRELVKRLWNMKNNPDLDIVEIVPLSILKDDHNFYSYIVTSNNRIAKCQTINLRKLAAFCRNPLLIDHRQEEFRKLCLKYWQIPDNPKVPLSKFTVDDLLNETVHNRELFLVQPRVIRTLKELDRTLNSVQEWHYTFMQGQESSTTCNFYAGVGMSRAYKLQASKWVKVKNLQLIRGTLLYGELVKEKSFSKIEDSAVQQKYSLHVIDALRLGDMDMGEQTFDERNKLISTYCKAINHEFRKSTIRVRPKIIRKLEFLASDLQTLRDDISQGLILRLPTLGYNSAKEFYQVNSLLFLKTKDQSFHSTYVLRIQLFMGNSEMENDECSSVEAIINFIEIKKK